MTAILSTRTEVAVGGIQQTPIAGRFLLLSGFSKTVLIENMTTTDDTVSDINDAWPVIDLHLPVVGSLVNVMVYSAQAGIELYLHEMMQDSTHSGSGVWQPSDQLLVTAGAPCFMRGFRFIGHRARLSIYNSAAYDITADLMVRVSTI